MTPKSVVVVVNTESGMEKGLEPTETLVFLGG